MQETLIQLVQLAFGLALLAYAFLLIFLGFARAGKAISSSVELIVRCTGKAAARLVKILVMTLVNSVTFLARIIASGGRPDQTTEAWARFVERMSDLILGA